jgi:hypothetical protein
LLWVATAALVVYGGWKVGQMLLDADRDGAGARGLAKRALYGAGGLVHLALAAVAANLALGRAMPAPGQALAAIGGVVAVAIGAAQLASAWGRWFMHKLDTGAMTVHELRSTKSLGRLALLARAAVLGALGGGLIAVAARARGAGLEGTLPFPPVVLSVAGIALAAYGIYCFTEARFRIVRA